MSNVTEGQKKLLLILLAVILLVVTWRFGYQTIADKTLAMEDENTALQQQIDTYRSLELQKDTFIQQTDDLNQASQQVIDKYGAGNTPEKIIMFLNDLAAQGNMTIPSVDFGEETNVTVLSDGTPLSEASVDAAAAGDSTTDSGDAAADSSDSASGDAASDTGDAATDGTADGSADAAASGAATKVTDYYLYNYPVTFSYTASYSGLKRAIDYINNYGERMNIENITVAYDSTTGRLAGSITLNMYTLTGTQKSYLAPEINGIGIGVANIFGSVE